MKRSTLFPIELNRLGRFMILGILLLMAMGLNSLLRTNSVSAAQTTPPPYAHGWYINNPDTSYAGAMQYRGFLDGYWDRTHCTNSAVILDFGQVSYKASSSYGDMGHLPTAVTFRTQLSRWL
jgi:hypothetical protein